MTLQEMSIRGTYVLCMRRNALPFCLCLLFVVAVVLGLQRARIVCTIYYSTLWLCLQSDRSKLSCVFSLLFNRFSQKRKKKKKPVSLSLRPHFALCLPASSVYTTLCPTHTQRPSLSLISFFNALLFVLDPSRPVSWTLSRTRCSH
jgi:hypothetical protein